MPIQPHKNPPPFAGNAIVQFLEKQLDNLTGIVSQTDVARALGYQKANIISMFKTGHTRVPLDKIPALAKVLDVDPAFLMRLGLEQYWPDDVDVLARMFGNIVSKNEKALIDVYRKAVGNVDFRLTKLALSQINTMIERNVAFERKYDALMRGERD